MSEYVQVWKAKVAEGDVEQLLAVRAEAVAEAKRLCPALVQATLVRAHDGTWLDVLAWNAPDGEEQLMARADEFDALNRMHSFLADAEPVGRGEVVASA
ncbi:MAG TPA: hypothetical protein VM938_13490 [Acidimicrobiales bacterium]|nr:hypothetical protein [Acidimicrobiales bacterium]